MSSYAMIRNAWDPVLKVFRLSAGTIELERHLDGNLCRCTGYRPIIAAMKTFITEDLRSEIVEEGYAEESNSACETEACIPCLSEHISSDIEKRPTSCGKPGGCCRDGCSPLLDRSLSGESECSSTKASQCHDSSSNLHSVKANGAAYSLPVRFRDRHPSPGQEREGTKTTSDPVVEPPQHANGTIRIDLMPYDPDVELLFPPALRNFQGQPICYGDSEGVWIRPTTLEQVLSIKALDPSAKLVAGSSEVQVEIRSKNSKFRVMVYIGDLQELQRTDVPESDDEIAKHERACHRSEYKLDRP